MFEITCREQRDSMHFFMISPVSVIHGKQIRARTVYNVDRNSGFQASALQHVKAIVPV